MAECIELIRKKGKFEIQHFVETGGEMLFRGKDVARTLGLKNEILKKVPSEDKIYFKDINLGRHTLVHDNNAIFLFYSGALYLGKQCEHKDLQKSFIKWLNEKVEKESSEDEENFCERTYVSEQKESPTRSHSLTIEAMRCLDFMFRNQPVEVIAVGDKQWFRGKHITDIFQYKDPKMALQNNVDKEDKTTLSELKKLSEPGSPNLLKPLSYHEGKAVFISLPGLFDLIMSCPFSVVKPFKKWVTHDVLPEIMRRGQYQLEQSMSMLAIKDDEIRKEKEYGMKTRAMLEQERREKEEERREKEEAQERERIVMEALEKEKRTSVRLKNIVVSNHKFKFTEVFYIVTSRSLASNKRFKIGGVKTRSGLKSRLSQYKGLTDPQDPAYFCFTINVSKYDTIEIRVKEILNDFKVSTGTRKEMFNIDFRDLKKIVEHVSKNNNSELEDFNMNIEEMLERLHSENDPFIPEPLSENVFTVTTMEYGHVINARVFEGADEQLDEVTKRIFEEVDKYIGTLPESAKDVKKKDLFDAIARSMPPFSRTEHYPRVQEHVKTFHSNVVLKYR